MHFVVKCEEFRSYPRIDISHPPGICYFDVPFHLIEYRPKYCMKKRYDKPSEYKTAFEKYMAVRKAKYVDLEYLKFILNKCVLFIPPELNEDTVKIELKKRKLGKIWEAQMDLEEFDFFLITVLSKLFAKSKGISHQKAYDEMMQSFIDHAPDSPPEKPPAPPPPVSEDAKQGKGKKDKSPKSKSKESPKGSTKKKSPKKGSKKN